ncbi:MAG: hypothetical protein ACP5MW_03615, partial [Thermoplasmata archaeon]
LEALSVIVIIVITIIVLFIIMKKKGKSPPQATKPPIAQGQAQKTEQQPYQVRYQNQRPPPMPPA